ncbi:hypothetical protein CLF_101432 [Clonorchis sinensis]|uniref:Uncharacterized protein n=1 Tax=Clonorchis sinensis TaxID=79923 RepID=G7Y5R0_CLOSI|nr:hypothetical protein CLF_101432 [Clonorchis sinensis]
MSPQKASVVKAIAGDSSEGVKLPTCSSTPSKVAYLIVDSIITHNPEGQSHKSNDAVPENLTHTHADLLKHKEPNGHKFAAKHRTTTNPGEEELVLQELQAPTIDIFDEGKTYIPKIQLVHANRTPKGEKPLQTNSAHRKYPGRKQPNIDVAKQRSLDGYLSLNDKKRFHMSFGGDLANALVGHGENGPKDYEDGYQRGLGIWLSSNMSFILHYEKSAQRAFVVWRTLLHIARTDFQVLYGTYARPLPGYANQVIFSGSKKVVTLIELVQQAATKIAAGLKTVGAFYVIHVCGFWKLNPNLIVSKEALRIREASSQPHHSSWPVDRALQTAKVKSTITQLQKQHTENSLSPRIRPMKTSRRILRPRANLHHSVLRASLSRRLPMRPTPWTTTQAGSPLTHIFPTPYLRFTFRCMFKLTLPTMYPSTSTADHNCADSGHRRIKPYFMSPTPTFALPILPNLTVGECRTVHADEWNVNLSHPSEEETKYEICPLSREKALGPNDLHAALFM